MERINTSCSFSGKVAEIYDVFFLGGIDSEIDYLLGIINEKLNNHNNLNCLDVGCGTGAHAYRMAQSGLKVTAGDISKDMLNVAKAKHAHDNIEYHILDATDFSMENRFNVVFALSHVIGYQLDNESVFKMLENIYNSLTSGGIFIFNFYHAPGVAENKLKSRIKNVQDKDLNITRCSNATNNLMENVLDLEYYYLVEELNEKENITSVTVHEKMRYFSKLEIEYYLKNAGFDEIEIYNYLTKEALTEDDWNGAVIAKKR